jgi:purine-cytosine permease-like protein
MDLIGYWLAIYEGISLTEHFFFKRGFSGYRPENYDNPKALPPGIAAVTAFCFGVAGMVVGSKSSNYLYTAFELYTNFMLVSQIWWTGPIAKHGGDVGFELAFAFAATSYFVLRHIELRYFGR